MLGMYSTILILWCFKKLWIVENFTLLIYCSVCHCRLTLYPIIQTRWPSHMWLLYYIPQIWLGQSENTLNFEVLVKNCSVSIFCWNDNTILCVCMCLFAQLHLTFCKLFALQPARFLSPWDFPGKKTEVGCHFLLLGIFDSGIQPVSLVFSALKADSLLAEPPRKP